MAVDGRCVIPGRLRADDVESGRTALDVSRVDDRGPRGSACFEQRLQGPHNGPCGGSASRRPPILLTLDGLIRPDMIVLPVNHEQGRPRTEPSTPAVPSVGDDRPIDGGQKMIPHPHHVPGLDVANRPTCWDVQTAVAEQCAISRGTPMRHEQSQSCTTSPDPACQGVITTTSSRTQCSGSPPVRPSGEILCLAPPPRTTSFAASTREPASSQEREAASFGASARKLTRGARRSEKHPIGSSSSSRERRSLPSRESAPRATVHRRRAMSVGRTADQTVPDVN